MGQYYHPTNLDKMEYLVPWKYNNGARLMEHSYIGNNLVGAVERLLATGGDWHQAQIIWAGDYMDEGLFLGHVKNIKHTVEGKEYVYNLYGYENDHGTEITPFQNKIKRNSRLKYLVNHTRMEYIDLTRVKEDETGHFRIHPLPLLTASGNGRGGGDYSGLNEDKVGSWAGHRISMESNKNVLQYMTEVTISFQKQYN